MRLHPDWPETAEEEFRWDYPAPYADLYAALDTGVFLTAGVPSEVAPPFGMSDIASVKGYAISGNDRFGGPDGPFQPGQGLGTDLTMILFGQLNDGRWFSVNAWNDYTGWGCRDDSQVRVAADERTIIANGLDNEGREALGLS